MYIQTHAYHTLLMNDDRNGNEETANIFISAGKCCAFFFFIQFNYSQKKVKGLLSRAASHTRLETMQRKNKSSLFLLSIIILPRHHHHCHCCRHHHLVANKRSFRFLNSHDF